MHNGWGPLATPRNRSCWVNAPELAKLDSSGQWATSLKVFFGCISICRSSCSGCALTERLICGWSAEPKLRVCRIPSYAREPL